MNRLTRRDLGRGFGALAACGTGLRDLPAWVGAERIDPVILDRMSRLDDAFRHGADAEKHFGLDARAWKLWPVFYEELVIAGDLLRDGLCRDTAVNRAIVAWARERMPPPCERARTYWTPMSRLSRETAETWDAYERSRLACLVSAKRAGVSLAEPAETNALDQCDARTTASKNCEQGWSSTVYKILMTPPSTSNETEPIRRVIQIYGNFDIIDLALLRKHLRDWESYIHDGWPQRCGQNPCRERDAWLA